jgi:hypothetical protein
MASTANPNDKNATAHILQGVGAWAEDWSRAIGNANLDKGKSEGLQHNTSGGLAVENHLTGQHKPTFGKSDMSATDAAWPFRYTLSQPQTMPYLLTIASPGTVTEGRRTLGKGSQTPRWMDPRPWASTSQRTPNWRNSIVTFPHLQNVILGMACFMPQVATHNSLPTATQGFCEAARQVACVWNMTATSLIKGTMERCNGRLQYDRQKTTLDTPKMVWGLPRSYQVPLGSRERAHLVDKSETDLIAVVVRWPLLRAANRCT